LVTLDLGGYVSGGFNAGVVPGATSSP
jgi:hypothetical protein